MRKKNTALEPLMYIEQPTEHIPHSTMQQTYSSLYDHIPTASEKSLIPSAKDQFKSKDSDPSEGSEQKDSKKAQGSEKKKNHSKEKQHFADLTIEEKIHYCTSTSSYIPKIMCVIKTDTKATIGIIEKYEEGIIYIKPRKSHVRLEIPLEEIINIRMVGF